MERAAAQRRQDSEKTARYADMLAAMGAEPGLRVMQLLLSAHPDGMVAGDIGRELDIPSSTLSHHLDKLWNGDLVQVLQRGYSANCECLQGLLAFLYAECCTRNNVIEPQKIVCCN